MRRLFLLGSLLVWPLASLHAADFKLMATPQTVIWGRYEAGAKPALTIHSGDTVTMQTLSTCGSPERIERMGVKPEDIPAYTGPIYKEVTDKGPGGHILTGPVAIAEAEPGDVLEVQIQKITLEANFACNSFGPRSGFIPQDFPGQSKSRIIALDRTKMIGHFAPGIDIPLHPFFGSMGVAPAEGRVNSAPPFAGAGNMDNKELVAGTTLYIPVAAAGALFEAGDGHAGQGNGEVDITAMETYLTGTFRFIVHKNQKLAWPRGETPKYYIAMGFDKDLKAATELALRNMIDFLVEDKHMTREDAYMLCSVAVDMDITQLVDGNVGVHAMLPKDIFVAQGK
jgi:acetamidase/formamidase